MLASNIAEAVKNEGGLALVVGGYARDKVLQKLGHKLTPKDIDVEVYGIDINRLYELLKQFGEPNTVGEQFKVIKLKGLDVSIPRRDSKTGVGHKGFTIEGDPTMSVQEAARRRDFTINALALNPLTGEIIDHWGGLPDAQHKVLHAVDQVFFKDDSLRVLRAMQFAGRFGFSIHPDTLALCRDIKLSDLPKERIGEEWVKLLLKSSQPSIGLEAGKELGIIEKLHPELAALIQTPQDPQWHPEGDVWTHTGMVVDAAAKLAQEKNLSSEEALVELLASLCHDVGKPATTVKQENGRITSHEHESAGVAPTKLFLKSINAPQYIVDKVVPLVENHLFPSVNRQAGHAAVRKLAHRLYPATIQELVYVGYADRKGRGTPWDGYPEGEELLEKARELSLTESKPMPLLMGRHLIELGMKPSRLFGVLLGEIFQLQLEGKIQTLEQAKNYVQLLTILKEAEHRDIPNAQLLNGELLTKQEMIAFVQERFLDERTHDMGTLVMSAVLSGEALPDVLEKNKDAILTAHKFGPVWFSRLTRTFYEKSWKSFYGTFEANETERKPLEDLSWRAQKYEGLKLITEPNQRSIELYNETFSIKPVAHESIFALYNTPQYPFEAGMFDGYRIMVQYNPEKRRVSVSVLDEDPAKVKIIDGKIRTMLPEFANAKKTGYLFASNPEGADDVFTLAEAERVYKTLETRLQI